MESSSQDLKQGLHTAQCPSMGSAFTASVAEEEHRENNASSGRDSIHPSVPTEGRATSHQGLPLPCVLEVQPALTSFTV